MKRTMGKTLGMIALATGIAGSLGSGCQTTPQGYNFGAGMVNQAVGSYISGQLDPKSTNVTVNNSVNNIPLDCVTIRTNNGGQRKVYGVYMGQTSDGYTMVKTRNDGSVTPDIMVPTNNVIEIVDN